MENYQQSYKTALQLNEENVNKWQVYRDELNETKKNLSQFIKSHSLEIMIPVGKKALIVGKLVHTNEVTICHGASYFSDCSTSQAIEIIESRIEKCDSQLEALNKERELFMNKISLPKETFGQGREIIEEYDETTETKWRQKHTESLRKLKEKERQERQHAAHEKEDINTFFDEFEMMEELAEELETMEIQDDDTLKKLLSGELKVPANKIRVALVQSNKHITDEENLPVEINNNDLIAQNNQEIVDLLRNYRCKIKEVLKNVKKDDERNVNLFLDLIELKDDIEDDIRRMNDDEILESDEEDSDEETEAIAESKPAEDGKRVRFSTSLEDVKLIDSKSEFFDAPQPEANTIQINFQHSGEEFDHKASDTDIITHPGEIYAKFHQPQKIHVPAKKSILKNKEKEKKNCETTDEKKVKKIFESDVQVIGEVKEHEKKEISQSNEELVHVSAKNENPKKMSKFKQMRMKS